MSSITLNILFFGPLKNFFGEKLSLIVPEGSVLEEVITKLKIISPEASDLLDSCKIAIDSTIEEPNFTLCKACEIAILPPFSGG